MSFAINKQKHKIIIYELNEVPRRLFDYYTSSYKFSSFSKLLKNGVIINTITNDLGELHPWSTWPSVHRGVYNNVHKIKFLNQDLSHSTFFKPIWQILNENNVSLGIFGSLQSYPPLKGSNIKFYLPDTFSPNSDAYPHDLSLFQSFNLKLTSHNKAISRSLRIDHIFDFLILFFKGIIPIASAVNTGIHIFKELLNNKYKTRRSIIQNVISFQIFKKYLSKSKPQFSTYFTNHVAGIMHRYWKYTFPEDFNLKMTKVDSFKSKSIDVAMNIADKDLKSLIHFSDNYGYTILVITAMGQDSIFRKTTNLEIILSDFELFCKTLGLKMSNYKLLPAMQPDYCILSLDQISMNLFRLKINSIKDSKGNNIFNERYPPVSSSLNISINKINDLDTNPTIFIDSLPIKIKNLGLEIINRDIGTAYHVPNGFMAVYGPLASYFTDFRDQTVQISRIAPTILTIFDIPIPNYMEKPLFDYP